jgi:hypothetical protein
MPELAALTGCARVRRRGFGADAIAAAMGARRWPCSAQRIRVRALARGARVVVSTQFLRPCGLDGCGGGRFQCLTTLPVVRVHAALASLLAETRPG